MSDNPAINETEPEPAHVDSGEVTPEDTAAPAEPVTDEHGVTDHPDGSREFTEVPWPGY